MCCHPERSEGSGSRGTEILRCAQDDRTEVDCYNSSSRPGGEGIHHLVPSVILSIRARLPQLASYPLVSPRTGEANRPSWYQSPLGTTFRSSSFFLSEKDFTMRPEQLEYTLAGHPCLAQYPMLDISTAAASPVSIVPSVPIVPTTPAAPGPANDQAINSQVTIVPIVPTVPCGEWRSTRFRMCRRESLGRPLRSHSVARRRNTTTCCARCCQRWL